ncbi:Transcription factor GTE10 [Sesamum alatum]|uniref:Transcription factor GTE10 n=1 Tax=Sesamum alatum TaxID=300844 RepID=A0AAE1XMM2_9LAMI|nr:Transcription factor GTE10 [Sesamum alatum]
MAPTIPIDYTGHRESRKFSKTGSVDMMGTTRKVSKGHSTGFVPDYRHAVETVAESEGFGSSGRLDTELTASQDSCVPSSKRIGLNVDGYDRSVVPIRFLSLSKMSTLERRDLEARLRSELEQVRKLQRKIASYTLGAADVYRFQNGAKRPATVESLAMSANDVPMAPGKKKCTSGRNGPRTKGGPVAARRNESLKQGPPQSTSFVMVMKQCETLLSRLMAHQHAWIFNTPVDIVKHNIPDYFNVIKHPMDLGTVKSKLLSNQYSSPMEFASDVRLTFKNAMTYNPPGHDVHFMAEVMSKYFEVRWKPIDRKMPPTGDESTSKSSVVIEPESAFVPPSRKQKTVSMENKVKQERDKRAMTDVEKQKLGVELESLLAELPDNIVNFMKESTLNSSQVSDDEIEIDIDTLSDDTLFTLRKLLDDYLREKQKKQAQLEPCEIEMQKESFRNLSGQPCKEHEPADEYVDIGSDDPPPMSSSSPIKIDKDTGRKNSNCTSSRSSSSESGSSSTDSESSSASEVDGVKNSVPASVVNKTVDTRVERKGSSLGDPNVGESLLGNAQDSSVANSYSIEPPNCRQEGESAPPERQVSPEKQYRAALLRSRFADIIIKAQENTIEKGGKPDAEKLKLEKEELERRRREEKARLQAEAKAAEEARKRAEVEAAAEARRKRELEREAARQALQQMEKTVDINENSQFMEDLEMFRSAPDEHLHSFIEEASPENSLNGLGSFKFRANSNPLEQLGLYMKNDEEEEEEVEPQSVLDTSNDPEEGEID